MIVPNLPQEPPSKISDRTVRQFAGLCLGIFGLLLIGSLYRHHGAPTVQGWIAMALFFVGGFGLIRPAWLRPVYLAVTFITRPIGSLMSAVMLGVIYYGFLTPLAVIFRITRRDTLNRRKPEVDSYWTPKFQPVDRLRYLRQYQTQQTNILPK